MAISVVAVATVAILLGLARSAPESALVKSLPGYNGTLPSKHYSGYVTIDEVTGKSLFYYLVLSEGKPSQDPVVLWLNGGPGCSSFDGFVYDMVHLREPTPKASLKGGRAQMPYMPYIGPFDFHSPKVPGKIPTLSLNSYSWSKVSNILYLDSPAGVGFSYSKNQSDYITGDKKTATDSHKFLLKWFELYPEFLSNPFFISGESYAGIYVPTLAYEVVKGIEAGTKPVLNFKGYLVGNGVTDEQFDGNALVPFVHGMALISEELFEEVNKECRGVFYLTENASDSCQMKLTEVDQDVSSLNMYDILEPCYHSPNSLKVNIDESQRSMSFRRLGENTGRPLPVRKRMFGRAWPLRAPVRPGRVPSWPELLSNSNSVPCTDDEVATAWLNNQDVRKALHVAEESLVGTWQLCTDKIDFTHDAGSMIPFHKNLTNHGYRALIYSGDHDMCVPYTGSEAWTRAMGYKVVDNWRPWISKDQVAGYLQVYDRNLTFLTIKGAGHTVPEYKPQEALDFYSRSLAGSRI